MKIEVAESLTMSWLRHAKQCQMVQMNWKPSNLWPLYNETTIAAMKDETERYFTDRYKLDLYKKNSSVSQLLQQSEIDVLGIAIGRDGIQEIHGVDVAFHESGLNYGTKEETISRVLKKMIRTAMLLHGYFNANSGEIVFASPKVYGNISEPLQKYLNELQQLLNRWNLGFKFSLICNDEFRDRIVHVVMSLSKSVADTSELFMRSIQMNNLFDKEAVRGVSAPRQTSPNRHVNEVNKTDNMKIGALVRNSMEQLARNNLLTSQEVERLQRLDYCKRTFNIGYPVLKIYDRNVLLDNQRNIKGYPRYYSDPVRIGNQSFLLCNDWYEDKNRSFFQAWMTHVNSE